MRPLLSLLSVSLLILYSCQAPKSNTVSETTLENPWIKAFKDRAFQSCLKSSYKNDTIFRLIEKEDIYNPYEGLYMFLEFPSRADSAGLATAAQLKPNANNDYEGKNHYMSYCLRFYVSKELDSLAKLEFEKYKILRSEEY